MEYPFRPIHISRSHLMNLLHYDPLTGEFTWISPPKNHPRMLGKAAGCNSTGYTLIRIEGVKYKAHRLAWLYARGADPKFRIDHKDGNTFNNAISNLRPATQAQNCANAQRWAGKLLPKGVRRNGSGFTARIRFRKRLITIGTFPNPEVAADAYFEAAKKLCGEFARKA